MLRALGEMLRHNLTYMRLATAPVLWMTVPLGLLLAQLHSHYGYDGLAVGQRAVVKARLRNSSTSPSPQARLAAPPGIRIETPPVWIPSIREVAWRVAAERPGDYVLKVQIGEDVFTKSVLVSDAIVRRSLADGRLISANGLAQEEGAYVRAVCTPDGTTLETEPVELVERPPMAEVTAR